MHLNPATSSGSLAVSTGANVWAPTTNAGAAASSANGVGAARVACVQVIPAAANAVFNLYDGTSTSGLLLVSVLALANSASVSIPFSIPIIANTNLYYSLSGASAVAIVSFIPGA